jgi:RNA polymerase primary sigma factor
MNSPFPPPILEALMSARTSEGSLRAYLREIAQVPLLTAEEEQTLAARVQLGDAGARDLMIRANLRLVVTIAFEHVNRGMALSDLISEGNLGLVTAVERFVPARNSRFATYAAWWIKQHIRRALSKDRTIRIPVHVSERIVKIHHASEQMTFDLGRMPSDAELAEELGLAASRVEQLRRASYNSLSLNAAVYGDDSMELSEMVGEADPLTPFDQTGARNQAETLHKALALLRERDRRIIVQRFGLDGTGEKTLAEIATQFGLTRERGAATGTRGAAKTAAHSQSVGKLFAVFRRRGVSYEQVASRCAIAYSHRERTPGRFVENRSTRFDRRQITGAKCRACCFPSDSFCFSLCAQERRGPMMQELAPAQRCSKTGHNGGARWRMEWRRERIHRSSGTRRKTFVGKYRCREKGILRRSCSAMRFL